MPRHHRDPIPVTLVLPPEPPAQDESDAILMAADAIARKVDWCIHRGWLRIEYDHAAVGIVTVASPNTSQGSQLTRKTVRRRIYLRI